MTDKKCPKCGARPSPHRAGFFMCDSKVFANGSFAEHITCLRRQLAQVEAEVARLYGLLDEIAEKRIYWLHEMRDERLPVGEVLNSFRAILARRNKEADDD